MKKKIIIPISIVLILVVAGFIVYPFFYDGAFVGKSHNIEITGETVSTNKSYGELAKVGDKLYYNYEPNSNFFDLMNYGLYEISSSGTKRMYWDGIKITDGSNLFEVDSAGDNLIRKFSDLPYDETSYGQIYKYNTSSKDFEVINKLSESTPAKMEACKYVDGKYFYYLQNSLYVQNGDKLEKIVELEPTVEGDELPIYRFYIHSDDEVYYVKLNGDKCVICSYSISGKKETEVTNIDLPYQEVTELYIDDNKAVIGLTSNDSDVSERNSMYVVNIADSESEPQELLSKKTSYGRTLVYGGKLYYVKYDSNENLICSIDLSNAQEENTLYKGDIANIHIVDGQGVYFTDSNKALYRIGLDGEKLETVFG